MKGQIIHDGRMFAYRELLRNQKVRSQRLARELNNWHNDTMKYRIRELRKKKGWTVEQLAEVVGTSKGYMSDLENGNRDGSVKMLKAIADAFGVREGEIFEAETEADQDVLNHMQEFMELPEESKQAVRVLTRGLKGEAG